MSDGFAHLPFLSNGNVASGSWFAVDNDEERFNEIVKRVRKWRLEVVTDITWYDGTATTSPVLLAGTLDFYAGADVQAPVSAYADEADLLCNFRATVMETATESVNGGAPGTVVFGMDGEGQWTENPTTLFTGIVSSYFRLGVATPDTFIYLHADSDSDYTDPTAISLVFDPGVSDFTITLYDDPDTVVNFPGSFWAGGPITITPVEWWPYEDEDGNPTWDTANGDQLADPRRHGSAGGRLHRLFRAA
jgi:hypothetical protein